MEVSTHYVMARFPSVPAILDVTLDHDPKFAWIKKKRRHVLIAKINEKWTQKKNDI